MWIEGGVTVGQRVVAMDSASRESFAKIESLESDLLQHVHTSGVREGKLRQLVDEIMAVRTDRRRLFTALTSENTSLVEKIRYVLSLSIPL